MDRLARLHTHLAPPSSPCLSRDITPAPTPQPAADANAGLKLLSDKQLKDFLVDGVAIVQVDDMPREWHEAFCK